MRWTILLLKVSEYSCTESSSLSALAHTQEGASNTRSGEATTSLTQRERPCSMQPTGISVLSLVPITVVALTMRFSFCAEDFLASEQQPSQVGRRVQDQTNHARRRHLTSRESASASSAYCTDAADPNTGYATSDPTTLGSPSRRLAGTMTASVRREQWLVGSSGQDAGCGLGLAERGARPNNSVRKAPQRRCPNALRKSASATPALLAIRSAWVGDGCAMTPAATITSTAPGTALLDFARKSGASPAKRPNRFFLACTVVPRRGARLGI